MLITSELLKIFSSSDYIGRYTYSKATNTCIRCGESARVFRDASARLEYSVSALCQKCQDELFYKNESFH